MLYNLIQINYNITINQLDYSIKYTLIFLSEEVYSVLIPITVYNAKYLF